MKTVSREDSVRRQALRPIQLARFRQFADSGLAAEQPPFSAPLVASATVAGWELIGGVLVVAYRSGRYWETPQLAAAAPVTRSIAIPLVASTVAQLRTEGDLVIRFSSPGGAYDARISAIRFILQDTDDLSPTWTMTYNVTKTNGVLTNLVLPLDTPDATTGSPVVTDALILRVDIDLTAGTGEYLYDFIFVDPMEYNDPGTPVALSPVREFFWSDRPVTYRYRNSTPVAFDARIRDVSVLSNLMSHLPTADGLTSLSESLQLTLLNHPDTFLGEPFADYIEAGWGAHFAQLEISQLNVDPDMTVDQIAALPSDSHDVWFRGLVRGIDSVDESTLRIVADARLERPNDQWLGEVLSDPTTADPDDLGKRYTLPLGLAVDLPLLGIDVPAYTTLSAPIDATQTEIFLTDSTMFEDSPPGSYWVLIGDEIVSYTGHGNNTLTGVTRGANGTTAAAHGRGETVIEIGTDSTVWTWGGIEDAEQLDAVRIRNAIAGDVLVSASPRWVDGATELTITGANLREELKELVTQGRALTQQPEVDSGGSPPVVLTESTTRLVTSPVQAGFYDGSTATGYAIGGGFTNTYQITFTNTPGQTLPPISQVIRVYYHSWGGIHPVGAAIYEGTTTANFIGSLPSTSGPYKWFEFAATDPSANLFNIRNPNTLSATYVAEIERRITYPGAAFSNQITTEAAAAVSVGKGLRVHARAAMYRKTAGDTAGQRYPQTTEAEFVLQLPDVLRHILDRKLGVDQRFVSQGGQLDDDTWILADSELATSLVYGNLRDLGETPEEAIGRLCWEWGVQLTRSHEVGRDIWRLHIAKRIGTVPSFGSGSTGAVSYVWPPPTRTVDQWNALTRSTVDGAQVYNTDYSFLYQFDYPHSVGDVEGYRKSLANTVVETSAVDFAAASRRRVGLRTSDGVFAFATVRELTDVARTAGYYHNEGARDHAKVYEVSGVPWVDGYDLELGDIVKLEGASGAGRIGAGRLFDPLDRLELDPLGEFGYVCRLAGDVTSSGYRVAWDLSFAESLSIEVQVAPTLWETSFELVLSSGDPASTDQDRWAFTQSAANVWETHTFDLSSPDSTVGAGADQERVWTIALAHAGAGSSSDDLLFTQARYAGADIVKCRVVGRDKTWGLRGDTVNLTLVEVT